MKYRKINTKFLIAVTFIILLSSCNFNKMFLVPTKLPENTKKIKMLVKKDTITVLFNSDNHYPVFLDKNKDTVNFDFIIESVNFKSKNGNVLNGWFLKPKNTKPKYTILHLHGNAGFLVSQFKAISPLVKNGFQVFMFDYSGFGFSQGKATRKNVLTDALSALDYLEKRPEIKNTKLIIYGQSLGGHLSAVVAEKRQNEIDGLVMEGAFSSHKDIANDFVPILGKIFVKQGYSALKSIKNFHKPLLIIHSLDDKTIPFCMAKKIYDAANYPKEFYQVNKEHISAPIYYSNQISDKIKSMIK